MVSFQANAFLESNLGSRAEMGLNFGRPTFDSLPKMSPSVRAACHVFWQAACQKSGPAACPLSSGKKEALLAWHRQRKVVVPSLVIVSLVLISY